MGDATVLTVLILFAELVVFAGLVVWQIMNWNKSRDALGQVDWIVRLKKFDLQAIIVSDVIVSQFDRMVELPLEKIRSFSNSALVIGIGGTMGLFSLEAILLGLSSIFLDGMEMLPWKAILVGLLLALLSSLMGVIYHLRITKMALHLF